MSAGGEGGKKPSSFNVCLLESLGRDEDPRPGYSLERKSKERCEKLRTYVPRTSKEVGEKEDFSAEFIRRKTSGKPCLVVT